jgi:hypothetical protein|tara:strand:- start:845 stop:1228 length:384 start_codon:yes stop_codon:yes gene_type:complete
MTMHLEGPWLSTNGKSKRKHKYRTAEAAQQARKNAENWKQLLDKHEVPAPAKRVPKRLEKGTYVEPKTFRRQTPYIPSHGSGVGTAVRKPDKVYTGDKIKGIGTMHKSNAVPVFSDEEAVAISKMRR